MPLLVFAIALFSRYLTAKRMDMTWDEATYLFCGVTAISNIVHRRFSSKDWEFEFHPPLGMIFVGLSYLVYILHIGLKNRAPMNERSLGAIGVSSFKGQNALVAIRIPSAIFGSLTAIVVFQLVLATLKNYEIALIASLLIAITPNFVAWTSIALLDGPLAFFYVTSVWFAFLATTENSLLLLLASGVLFGLALATKISGAMAMPVFLLWFFLSGTFLTTLVWTVTSIITYYLAYPTLWTNPLGYLLRNLKAQRSLFAHTKRERITFHFENLFATTPLPITVGAITGLLLMSGFVQLSALLLIMGAFVPLTVMSMPKIPKYGLNTYIYPLPVITIVAAMGIEKAEEVLGLPSFLLSTAAVLLVSYSVVTTFPYFVGYQNLLPKLITRTNRYIGYMGEGLSNAIHFVESNAREGGIVWIYGPKSTSLYHSTRVNLRATFGNETIFVAREKAGFDVPVDSKIYELRVGDICFYYPYYYDLQLTEIVKSLRDRAVEFIVLYKAALSEISQSSQSSGNNTFCKFIHDNCSPTYSVLLKGIEVCWVYKVDKQLLNKIKSVM